MKRVGTYFILLTLIVPLGLTSTAWAGDKEDVAAAAAKWADAFGAETPDHVEDTFYWARVKFGLKPTLRVVQMVTMRGNSVDPVAYAIAEKQLYSSHYFETALDLSFCGPRERQLKPSCDGWRLLGPKQQLQYYWTLVVRVQCPVPRPLGLKLMSLDRTCVLPSSLTQS
jgi:hypothetical protein